MRGNASKFPDKRESQRSAKARMVAMLYGCRPAALDRFTVDGLAATHSVPVREVEYELTIARQKRAGEAR